MEYKMLDQIKSGGIEPLQIIEEQCQRMLWSCKYADKSSERYLEAPLRFLWRKNWEWRLLPYNQLQFRNQIHNEPSVWTQRLMESAPPVLQLGFALTQKETD